MAKRREDEWPLYCICMGVAFVCRYQRKCRILRVKWTLNQNWPRSIVRSALTSSIKVYVYPDNKSIGTHTFCARIPSLHYPPTSLQPFRGFVTYHPKESALVFVSDRCAGVGATTALNDPISFPPGLMTRMSGI